MPATAAVRSRQGRSGSCCVATEYERTTGEARVLIPAQTSSHFVLGAEAAVRMSISSPPEPARGEGRHAAIDMAE